MLISRAYQYTGAEEAFNMKNNELYSVTKLKEVPGILVQVSWICTFWLIELII